ncbi:Uncharacterised protein [Elizabethkingia miricola]|jgi:hypothetical protein|uniref:DUF551 domain-containing protein n=1 Tax=Elizabethkingia miricola TaxID=172045 RepID=A0ABD4DQ67_ELIMR|nr:hypothetical protein [Elizabethkingia miricola]KUY20877.1 hypothetical protein ATB95_08245 [Elizabethkingia miricola]MCL1652912.1 hypothetical protein [Elizabethkingia miricola]SPW34255.1 Uncharacterised protein [Elizabethkingia miricola]DAT28623.1 MAG TPA: hypothetical protein [Caudoviricetes sp.]
METPKEQAIKAAYGELYDKYKNRINENGWFNAEDPKKHKPNHLGFIIGDVEILSSLYWRPKVLNGIETNNSWTRIESEEDNPKESGKYWVILSHYSGKKSPVTQECYYIGKGWDSFLDVTHYQPIETPKPPIF